MKIITFRSTSSRNHAMRPIVSLLLLAALTGPLYAQVKLPAELKTKLSRLARIEAQCDTPVKWINLHDDLDLIPDSNGKTAILLGAKIGRYKIAAYTCGKDGPSDPAYCIIIVEGEAPPAKPQADPEGATARLRFGNAGCTATIIGPRRADGRWDVLTAAHCTGGIGSTGTMTLRDGRAVNVTVAARNTTHDLAWLIADIDAEDLPHAVLASAEPPSKTAIFHIGYGTDRPGNKESGVVLGGPDANGQLRMNLSVSPGDSGSGIFRADTGELVAVVCCTTGGRGSTTTWGGSAAAAARMRPAQEEVADQHLRIANRKMSSHGLRVFRIAAIVMAASH
jgi:hypothetical protein